MLCPGIQVRGLANHTLLIDLENCPAEIIWKDYRGQHRLSKKDGYIKYWLFNRNRSCAPLGNH